MTSAILSIIHSEIKERFSKLLPIFNSIDKEAWRGTRDPFRYSYTLPPGDEKMFLTERYESRCPLYYDVPPYIAKSYLRPGEAARGMKDLPEKLGENIFKKVTLLKGPLLVSMDDSEDWAEIHDDRKKTVGEPWVVSVKKQDC
ncbi:hypothetical protein CFE70_008584 [Pyrenophora teres f. teres 0-1]